MISTSAAVDQLKSLADHKSPEHVQWRYDPIITTRDMNPAFHLYNFEKLAQMLEGYTKRCYVEFLDLYRKVERNFSKQGVTYIPLTQAQKQDLVNGMAAIAASYGIQVYACCDTTLVSEAVQQAHCIDPALVIHLTGRQINYKFAPTRNDCGCAKSIDIGEYGTCLHGCLYCYACDSQAQSRKFYDAFDDTTPSLDAAKLENPTNKDVFSLIQISLNYFNF